MNQPKYKICRRLGAHVFGKCENPKFSLVSARKSGAKKRPRQLSEYGLQLIEKQKARYLYGLSERQFAGYVKNSTEKRGSNPISELYKTLESRLDNVVFRLGFAKTRAFARQMVSHGHITVNGRKITIPSHHVKARDVVGIRKGSEGKALFLDLAERLKGHTIPAWLSVEESKKEGRVTADPIADNNSEALFNLASVVEFYSR